MVLIILQKIHLRQTCSRDFLLFCKFSCIFFLRENSRSLFFEGKLLFRMNPVLETVNDTATAAEVKIKCLATLQEIDWMNQIQFTDESTVAMAMDLARQGLDGGMEGTLKLQPKNLNFHDWMQYAHLCTILYNRTKVPEKYTILRNS